MEELIRRYKVTAFLVVDIPPAWRCVPLNPAPAAAAVLQTSHKKPL